MSSHVLLAYPATISHLSSLLAQPSVSFPGNSHTSLCFLSNFGFLFPSCFLLDFSFALINMPTQAELSEILGSIGTRRADEIYRQYLDGSTSVLRPGFNPTGREVDLVLNAYQITGFPTQNVYQYDVSQKFLSHPDVSEKTET